MQPLTFDVLKQCVQSARRTVEFPNRGIQVTVRELTAAEFVRVHQLVQGKDENDPAVQREVQVLLCSIAITDADYDNDEGRAQIAVMPSRMRERIASVIFEMSAIDVGGIPKNLPSGSGSPSTSAAPLDGPIPTTCSRSSRNGSSGNGRRTTTLNRGGKNART